MKSTSKLKTRPKTKDLPAYLFVDNFVVTRSLAEKIETQSQEDREKLCYIQSVVITLSEKNRHPALFTNIHSRVFKRKIRNYKKYVDLLAALGELEVNPHWSKGGFTMSYRVPPDKLQGGVTEENFRKRRVRLSVDKSNIDSSNVAHQRACLKELKVSDEFISTGDLKKDIRTKTALQRIAQGIGDFTEGKNSGRISNAILQMPKDGRKNLLHKDGAEICEYDIRSCHPFFLIGLCTDEAERIAYGALISDPKTDIYTYVANEMNSSLTRDELKIAMLRFINGGRETIFDKFFQRNFPLLWQKVRAGGKTNASTLQKVESKLMADLGEWCAANNLYFIVENDGFVAKCSEAPRIIEYLKNLIFNLFGYYPNIDMKERFSHTKTNNDKKESLTNLSYVVLKHQPANKGRVFPEWLKAKIRREAERKRNDPIYMENWRKRNVFSVKDKKPDPEDEREQGFTVSLVE